MDVRAKRDRERELNARIVTERTSGGGQLVVVENVGSADDDMDDGARQSKNLYTWVCVCSSPRSRPGKVCPHLMIRDSLIVVLAELQRGWCLFLCE